MKTPEWGAAFLRNDAKARAQHDTLQAIRAGIVPPGASANEAQGAAYLNEVKNTPELAAKFAAGNPEVKAKVAMAVRMQAEGASMEDAAIAESTTPPAKPTDYNMGPLENPTKEQLALDATLRHFLYDARVPRAIGDSVVAAASKALKNFRANGPWRWQRMDESARVNHGEATLAQLRGLWRDRFDDNLKAAHGLIDELDRKHSGKVYAVLDATGLGSDVNFIAAVAAHAERLALRAERRGAEEIAHAPPLQPT